MEQVIPQLSLLTEEQIDTTHQASLEILANTGIKMHSKHALDIFASADGTITKDDQVFISSDLIQQCLDSAPSAIQIYDRLGESQFEISTGPGQRAIFGVGVTNTHCEDPETGEIQAFERHHVTLAAKLAEALPNYDLLSTPGVLEDPDLEHAEVLASLEMLANTTKPLVLLLSNVEQFETTMDLFEHLLGDLASKPSIIPYFNPVTPLVLNSETSDKMISSIERGLPIIYSSYGMSGATAPITAAGTFVLHNAELLAWLVFSQLVNPGSPIILGCLPSVFEMRHMTSAYTPQTMLVNLACADMMAHYQIPHAGTSGSGAGWGPDLLASGMLWMNHLSSAVGNAGLVPFVGGNFDSLVFSPLNVVYSNEIIRLVRLFTEGFALDADAIDLKTIQDIGAGGNFLQSDQTLRLFMEIHEQHSQIWPGVSLEAWQKMESPEALEMLRTKTLDILEQSTPPFDRDDLLQRGEAWLGQKRK